MAHPVVTRVGVTSRVEFLGEKAFVATKPVRIKVHTMNGLQHHRGYVGTVTFDREVTTCGHRLHLKSRVARECAEALAKRMLRGTVR